MVDANSGRFNGLHEASREFVPREWLAVGCREQTLKHDVDRKLACDLTGGSLCSRTFPTSVCAKTSKCSPGAARPELSGTDALGVFEEGDSRSVIR